MIRRKKIFIIAAACCMTLSMLSGCGKKDVDYNVDENQGGGSSASSSGEGLAEKLGIPETIDETLATGASGLASLEIEAAEVHIPDTDHMSVVYCTSKKLTAERKQEIAEMLFDKDEGIYVYDYEHRIKSDIEEELEWCEKQRESDSAQGYDTSWIDDYEAELQEELATAPDEYPAAESYEGDSYIGTYNGMEYMLTMTDEGNVFQMNEDIIKYRPCSAEGAANGYYTYDETYAYGENDIDDGLNTCTMSMDEAESLALNMLGELGISDIIEDAVYPLKWVYYDDMGEAVKEDYEGYAFKFARSVDGGKSCDISFTNVGNLQTDEGFPNFTPEYYYVYVDNNGVVYFDFTDVLALTGEVESDVDLLSYSELIEKANTSIAQYYTDYPTSYAKIEYNGAYLTYYVTVDEENEDQFKYIPVWIFTQYEEYQDDNWSERYPDQAVMLDARDGSYIDVVQVLKDLGFYGSWYETDDETTEAEAEQ